MILSNHYSYEGSFEATPALQYDVDKNSLFSLTFFIHWFLSCFAFLILWSLTNYAGVPQIFYFALGFMFLSEGAAHVRHFRNYGAYKSYEEGAITGKINTREFYDLRKSYWELIGFSLLFLFISIIQLSLFFLGGVFGCLYEAHKHKKLSIKAYSEFMIEQNDIGTHNPRSTRPGAYSAVRSSLVSCKQTSHQLRDRTRIKIDSTY